MRGGRWAKNKCKENENNNKKCRYNNSSPTAEITYLRKSWVGKIAEQNRPLGRYMRRW
jgi:hypothetical protein